MQRNPIKVKKCGACHAPTYYNPTAPYQTAEERNPSKCPFCGALFKR